MRAPLAGDSFEWVNSYVGIPWLVNGRSKAGVDCWGIVLAVYREQRGIDLPDWQVQPQRDHYGDLVHSAETITGAAQLAAADGRAVVLEAPEDWSIVVVHRRRLANHVGIVVAGGHFVLHCAEGTRGTVCEPIDRFRREHPNCSFWRWTG